MKKTNQENDSKIISYRQQLFLNYFVAILVDLAVLNFFAEYWNTVTITTFGISFLVAVLLQILLKMTIALEHRIALYFKSHDSFKMKAYRILSTWFILFSSKFAMLGILELIFADQIVFSGVFHGVVAFIVVVTTMLLCEYGVRRIYQALA
jgi:hypothetical protein